MSLSSSWMIAEEPVRGLQAQYAVIYIQLGTVGASATRSAAPSNSLKAVYCTWPISWSFIPSCSCIAYLPVPCAAMHCLHPVSLLTGGPGAAGGRGLEESFVVLPGSASVLRPNAATQLSPSGHSTSSRDLQHTQSLNAAGQRSGAGPAGGTAAFPGDPTSGTAASTAGAGSRAAKAGFNAKLDTMARLCELASTVTAVDHPLCLDCAAQLKDEVQKQLEELESEIAAYSEAAKRLEAEAPVQLPQVGSSDAPAG